MRPVRLLFPFVFLLVFLAGCSTGLDTSGLSDAEAARLIFVSLCGGDQRSQPNIDWDVLRVGSDDFASRYRLQTTDQAKRAFRDEFVNSFPQSLARDGYNADLLTDWTVVSQDANWIVVTATGEQNSKTTVTLSKRDGQRRLASIDWPAQFHPHP
jgi:hypothetical protein